MNKLICGVAMFFGAIWGGCYFTFAGLGLWWGLPSFMTAIASMVAGIVLMVVGAHEQWGPYD